MKDAQQRIGGHAARALAELVNEDAGRSCCTAERACAKHERIDAQVAFSLARKAYQDAQRHNLQDIEERHQAMIAVETRYHQSVVRERTEEQEVS